MARGLTPAFFHKLKFFKKKNNHFPIQQEKLYFDSLSNLGYPNQVAVGKHQRTSSSSYTSLCSEYSAEFQNSAGQIARHPLPVFTKFFFLFFFLKKNANKNKHTEMKAGEKKMFYTKFLDLSKASCLLRNSVFFLEANYKKGNGERAS